jgi:hypothetical protein
MPDHVDLGESRRERQGVVLHARTASHVPSTTTLTLDSLLAGHPSTLDHSLTLTAILPSSDSALAMPLDLSFAAAQS